MIKHRSYIGIVCALLVMISVFLPWVYIDPLQATLTGMNTDHTNLGKPGILYLFFAFWIIVNMLINRLWSKRINLVLGALLVAWMMRNYLLFSHCEAGYCPTKRWGLFVNLIASIATFLAILFPPADPQDSDTRQEI